MSVILVRIDDRLVHGQVVEGWLRSLHVSHVVVASDVVEADETQKALYLLAVPHGIELSCMGLRDAAQAWAAGRWESGRVLILVSSPDDALRLALEGAPLRTVNVGGLHYREGRVQVLKAVSVDERDISALRELSARGIALEARPLPLDEPIDLKSHVEKWAEDRHALGDQPR